MAQIEFEPPQWLSTHAFSVQEVSDVIGVPEDTISTWLSTAALLEMPLHTKPGYRRELKGHAIYVLGILASLHRQNIPVTPRLIRIAYRITHPGGVPKLPSIAEAVVLSDEPEPSAASIWVDLTSIWIDLEGKLSALVGADG